MNHLESNSSFKAWDKRTIFLALAIFCEIFFIANSFYRISYPAPQKVAITAPEPVLSAQKINVRKSTPEELRTSASRIQEVMNTNAADTVQITGIKLKTTGQYQIPMDAHSWENLILLSESLPQGEVSIDSGEQWGMNSILTLSLHSSSEQISASRVKSFIDEIPKLPVVPGAGETMISAQYTESGKNGSLPLMTMKVKRGQEKDAFIGMALIEKSYAGPRPIVELYGHLGEEKGASMAKIDTMQSTLSWISVITGRFNSEPSDSCPSDSNLKALAEVLKSKAPGLQGIEIYAQENLYDPLAQIHLREGTITYSEECS